MPIHLHTTAPLAERVLLPGDPGRALRLAQALLDSPKMFNHNRGLWGYSGPALSDGRPLTIQSTGMGGPSAAIVISELISLGARRLVRIGTCGALDPDLALGTLLTVDEAICEDGTSRALGAAQRVPASAGLLAGLVEAAGGPVGATVSADLFYDDADHRPRWRALGARAVEMEAATLFQLALRHRVQAGALLLVTDQLGGSERARIEEDALQAGELALGRAAAAALAA